MIEVVTRGVRMCSSGLPHDAGWENLFQAAGCLKKNEAADARVTQQEIAAHFQINHSTD